MLEDRNSSSTGQIHLVFRASGVQNVEGTSFQLISVAFDATHSWAGYVTSVSPLSCVNAEDSLGTYI